jgi:hypothetical protein
VRDYDQQIEEVAKRHPDYEIFKSVPGVGPALAPRLIALFGTDRERWRDALSLLTQCGVAPVIKSSGKTTSVHQRQACPKFRRQTLIELAATSLKVGCEWVQAFNQDRKAKGWRYPRILYAVAFKWGRILWKIWQDRTLYLEAKRTPKLAESLAA